MVLMSDELSPREVLLRTRGNDVVDAPASGMLPYSDSLTMRELPIVCRHLRITLHGAWREAPLFR
jgi:hypothetical protein